MMRVLFDTNVLLDVLLNRQPWVVDASAVWQLNDDGEIDGFVAASALTDVFYIARRLTDVNTALQSILICLDAFGVCTVDRATIVKAVSLPGKDFEDNVLIACAIRNGMDTIVTRNTDDFNDAPLAISTPASLLAELLEPIDTDDVNP